MTTTAPSSVSLRLPRGWLELDPRADDIVAELRRTVGDRGRGQLAEDELLSLLAPLGLELRRLGTAAEIVLVGLYTDVVPVDGSDVPLVVTAHAMLAVSPPIASLDALRRELAEGTENVDLAAGPAVRQSGMTSVGHPDWDEAVPAYRRRFFVPLPGTDRLATLTFLTPNTGLAEVFADVFDAVADTLTFRWDPGADG
jgi:hypothetical protein